VSDGQAVYVAGGSPNCGGGTSETLMIFTDKYSFPSRSTVTTRLTRR